MPFCNNLCITEEKKRRHNLVSSDRWWIWCTFFRQRSLTSNLIWICDFDLKRSEVLPCSNLCYFSNFLKRAPLKSKASYCLFLFLIFPYFNNFDSKIISCFQPFYDFLSLLNKVRLKYLYFYWNLFHSIPSPSKNFKHIQSFKYMSSLLDLNVT